jgi:DNA-binding XRE family transcriptional regulator
MNNLLAEHRGYIGMTQAELSEASGVSIRTIQVIEAGTQDNPRLKTMRALCRALSKRRKVKMENVWPE